MGSTWCSFDSMWRLKARLAVAIFSSSTLRRILKSALKQRASAATAEIVVWGRPNCDAMMESWPVARQWMRRPRQLR